MNDKHSPERISAYADGELPPEQAREIERHIRSCTECARELALIRAMGGAMKTMESNTPPAGMWGRVHRRITRPIGWLLLVAGTVVWGTLAVVEWFRAGELTLEWLATTAIGIGLAMLLVGIGYEQYSEWKTSPYKDVER